MSRLLIKLLLWFLLLLAAGVLAHFMVRHPGYVMIAWGQWMLEITLWAAIGVMLATGALVALLVWLFRVSNPFRWLQRYRNHRDQKVARVETAHAARAWLAGNDEETVAALERVAKAGGSERLPNLLALVAAQETSAWDERAEQWSREDPELAWVVQALRAEQLWQPKETGAFLDWLERHPALQTMRGLRQRYWQSLLQQGQAERLLTEVKQADAVNPADRERWQTQAALQLLASDQQSKVAERLKLIPKNIREHAQIKAAEIRALAAQGDIELAFKRLKKALEKQLEDELIGLLTELPFDTRQSLELAEHLEKNRPESALLQLALGQLCERETLWGKAEDYFKTAWQLRPVSATGLALAEHFEHRSQPQKALPIYKLLAAKGMQNDTV